MKRLLDNYHAMPNFSKIKTVDQITIFGQVVHNNHWIIIPTLEHNNKICNIGDYNLYGIFNYFTRQI